MPRMSLDQIFSGTAAPVPLYQPANQNDRNAVSADIFAPQQNRASLDEIFGQLQAAQPAQAASQQPVGYGEDMLKGGGSGMAEGALYATSLPGQLVNGLFTGPQYLAKGISDTVMGNPTDRNYQPWAPYLTPDQQMEAVGFPPYEPTTLPGKAMKFAGNLLGGVGAAKAVPAIADSAIMADESSGLFPQSPAPQANASVTEKLGTALSNAQQRSRFSGPPNALQSGMEANQAISHQYGIDTQLQRDLYGNLNQAGRFSMPANEVYSKGNSLISSLEKQVAPESYEKTALSNLQDIMENLQNKNTPPPTYDPAHLGMKAEQADPYGVQASDAVDIKSTLNQLAKSGKFTNAGQAKILEFKSHIQSFLDSAKEVSPEFADALDKAETQAARVGAYKDPKLAQLWSPKDYMSYKGGNEPSAQTFDRGANFMGKLNAGSPAAGEAYSLTQILPHEQLQDIFRNALLQNKGAPSESGFMGRAIGKVTNPFGVRTWAGTSPDSPLLTLADQLRGGMPEYGAPESPFTTYGRQFGPPMPPEAPVDIPPVTMKRGWEPMTEPNVPWWMNENVKPPVMNKPPSLANMLALPAPETTVNVNGSGVAFPMTPATRQALGQSPNTRAELRPSDPLVRAELTNRSLGRYQSEQDALKMQQMNDMFNAPTPANQLVDTAQSTANQYEVSPFGQSLLDAILKGMKK